MRFFPEIAEVSNQLIEGENLEVMKYLIESGYEGKFKMIYFDGPFNSGIIYSDTNQKHGFEYVYPWSQYNSIYHYIQPERYLDNYRKRIKLAGQLLSEDGFFVLQTNQLFAHNIKVILEETFGRENMLPEVIWKHSNFPWPVLQGYPVGYQHENIFFYSKSENFKLRPDLSSVLPSVWDDILGYQSGETQYPTQKPEKLIERIIDVTTQEGDLVGDFYCGSGTFPFVAEKKRRKWLSCDNNPLSIELTTNRLLEISKSFHVHHAADDFNPSLMKGNEYTKVTKTPLSSYELRGLRYKSNFEVNAYHFSSDVDLENEHQHLTLNYIFPLITQEGFSETKTIKMPRPVPTAQSDGYRLIVKRPLEWILYHLIFVERNELGLINLSRYDTKYEHIFQWQKTLKKAEEILSRINDNWIAEIVETDQVTTITDIFGNKYSLWGEG